MAKTSKSSSAKASVIAPFQGFFKMVRDVMLGRQDQLDNRRTEARFRVSIPLIARMGEDEAVCESVDIGNSGIRLLMPNALSAGDQLRLSVPSDLGFAGHQRLLCEVAWSKPVAGRGFETGLLFADSKQNFEDSWVNEALRFFKLEEKANRKYRRIPAEVFSEVFSQDGSSIGKGICKNLSPGGALLKFDRELTQGDIVKLGMGPSEQEAAIFMLGRVVLRQPADQPGFYLHSLRFLKGDRRQHLRLRSFLQTLLEEAASSGQNQEDELPIPFSSLLENQTATQNQRRSLPDDEETRKLVDANAEGKIRVPRAKKAKAAAETKNSLDFNLPVPLGAPVDAQAVPYPTQSTLKAAEPARGEAASLESFRRPDDRAAGRPLGDEGVQGKAGQRPDEIRATALAPLALERSPDFQRPEKPDTQKPPEIPSLISRLERIPLGAPIEPSPQPEAVTRPARGLEKSLESRQSVAADELPQNSPKLKDRLKEIEANPTRSMPVDMRVTSEGIPSIKQDAPPPSVSCEVSSQTKPFADTTARPALEKTEVAPKSPPAPSVVPHATTPKKQPDQSKVVQPKLPSAVVEAKPASQPPSAQPNSNDRPAVTKVQMPSVTEPSPQRVDAADAPGSKPPIVSFEKSPVATPAQPNTQKPPVKESAVPSVPAKKGEPKPSESAPNLVPRSNSMWAARSLPLRSTGVGPKNSKPSVAAPEPPDAERDFRW